MTSLAAEPWREFGVSFRAMILTAAVCTSLLIFVLDSLVPLGVAMGAFQVIPVVLSLASENRRDTLLAAALGSILILSQFAMSPLPAVGAWTVYADRLICVFVVWVTALLGSETLNVKRKLRQVSSLLTVCAYTKQIRVGDRWMTIDAYLRDELGLPVTHGITEEAAQRLLHEWKIELERRPK